MRGGCDQPASACEVHHLTHKADGGKTSVRDCILFCTFHHQVVIHQMGWTVVLNPDGTTTAWNKNRTKVLHSHSPPPPPRETPKKPAGGADVPAVAPRVAATMNPNSASGLLSPANKLGVPAGPTSARGRTHRSLG